MNSHTTFANDQDFTVGPTRLPRGLRDEATDLSWDALLTTYATGAGPVRLGTWVCADAHQGPQARTYQATIAVGDRIATSTAAAAGPIGALTAMLYERGVAVEMLNFHQLESGGHTATFIRGHDGVRSRWAMGVAPDPTQSALRAVIACANRLAA